MIATSWSLVLILAQTACGGIGLRDTAATELIVRMQTCPNWRARDNAAHALRRFDWRSHPEVVEALTYTLLHDGSEEVREEAAQSLTRMAPCLAVAHEALTRAATVDPDHATRRWARKGLRALGGRCEASCKVCGPEIVGPIVGPITITPVPPVGEVVIPGPAIGPGEVLVPGPSVDAIPAPPASADVVPPVATPGESNGPPVDSRVDPPPTELSPLPPPPPPPAPEVPPSASPSASADRVRTASREATAAPARGRNRLLPFGVRLPSIFSRR